MKYKIKEIKPKFIRDYIKLLEESYSFLESFLPKNIKDEYFKEFSNISKFYSLTDTKILIVQNEKNELMGGLVYFSNLIDYGLTINHDLDFCSAIRFFAVKKEFRGQGIGNKLIKHCIDLTKKKGNKHIILHSIEPMDSAISLYKKNGFKRDKRLDYMNEKIFVMGYIYEIDNSEYILD